MVCIGYRYWFIFSTFSKGWPSFSFDEFLLPGHVLQRLKRPNLQPLIGCPERGQQEKSWDIPGIGQRVNNGIHQGI